MVPGPTIRVGVGDKVRVVLKNELPESTVIHFHGLIVPNARFGCANLVIFAERAPGLALIDTTLVDWDSWRPEE